MKAFFVKFRINLNNANSSFAVLKFTKLHKNLYLLDLPVDMNSAVIARSSNDFVKWQASSVDG